MTRTVSSLLCGLLLSCSCFAGTGPQPQGTAFTYQGRLTQDGVPVDGTRDMVFRLHDTAEGGTPYAELVLTAVPVAAGLFSVELDSGPSAVLGQQLWLEVEIAGQVLVPRQLLGATPYALYALDGNPGPQGEQGPPGSANISGTAGKLVRFDDTNSGSNSILSDDGQTAHVGGPEQATKLAVAGGIALLPESASVQIGGQRVLARRGFGNLFVGVDGLSPDSTGIGANNTGVGTNALSQLGNGEHNTAVGFQALVNLTDGEDNTVVGKNAMTNLTTGSNNIAVGEGAGSGLTIGISNIYLDAPAGSAAESGVIRLGSDGEHTHTYVAGVRTSPLTGDVSHVVVDASGRLGVGSLPATVVYQAQTVVAIAAGAIVSGTVDCNFGDVAIAGGYGAACPQGVCLIPRAFFRHASFQHQWAFAVENPTAAATSQVYTATCLSP